MSENFIVDWQGSDLEQTVGSVVSVRLQGRKAGLYRIKQVLPEGMLLSQGAISFPVGTHLDIDGLLTPTPGAQASLRVVANEPGGLSLAW